MSAWTPAYSRVELDVPEGTFEDWMVRKIVVDRDEEIAKIKAMMSIFNGHGSRFVPNGNYYQLLRGDTVVMSNTPDEIEDHKELRFQVRTRGGHVLINGLGLGMALEMIMPFAEHVTVIECALPVIRLTGDHYMKKFTGKLDIIHADAFDYVPPKDVRYTCVWHDIWDTISANNLPDMHKLHRKYGRRCDWQGSWARWLCERQR